MSNIEAFIAGTVVVVVAVLIRVWWVIRHSEGRGME